MSPNPFFDNNSIRGIRYISGSLVSPPSVSYHNIVEYEFLLKHSNRRNRICSLMEMKYLLFSNLENIALQYDSNNYVNEDINEVLNLHDHYTNQLIQLFLQIK